MFFHDFLNLNFSNMLKRRVNVKPIIIGAARLKVAPLGVPSLALTISNK